MPEMAEHLKRVLPARLATAPDPAWNQVVAALEGGDHLEAAMEKVSLAATTIEAIVSEAASLILHAEEQAFRQVLSGNRMLPLTGFVKHLFKAGKKFHLITTNYDRLVEMATEAAGIGVDSRFFGYLHGRSDPKRAADAHRESYISGKHHGFRTLPCLCVYKPHGSLDWFEVCGQIVRSPVAPNDMPVIITPGTSKYRESFRWAFDDQRTAGNRAASTATRLMFIGYGFNDDHLEQYLCPNLRLTKPTVIVTKRLSENARKVTTNSKGTDVLALCAVSETDQRTRIVTQTGDEMVVEEQLWNLEGFNQGVL